MLAEGGKARAIGFPGYSLQSTSNVSLANYLSPRRTSRESEKQNKEEEEKRKYSSLRRTRVSGRMAGAIFIRGVK